MLGYGTANDILYNNTKSQLMLFDTRMYNNYDDISLNDVTLKYVEKYKYLGHIITNKLSDDADMKSKIDLLYARSNMLVRKFYFCSSAVKNRLFNSYCCNIYLCVLWRNFKTSSKNAVRVAYNNAFRIINNFSRRCSASGMFANNNVRSLISRDV